MELSLVEENGIQLVEGQPDQPFLSRVQDVGRVVEMCLSSGADAALLYASNLTAAFFDLSSGEAGEILQKLLNLPHPAGRGLRAGQRSVQPAVWRPSGRGASGTGF
jgi:hypothetical protein